MLRFLVVGGTCFAVTCAINYLLKLTVLAAKPVTALVIATVVATALSYTLNRQWTFRTRGGRAFVHESALFFGVNGVAIVINSAPLWIARYVLDLRVPEVSRLVQEVSDFCSGIVLGTALAMVFRLWAYRRWVFPTVRTITGAERQRAVEETAMSGTIGGRAGLSSVSGRPPRAEGDGG